MQRTEPEHILDTVAGLGHHELRAGLELRHSRTRTSIPGSPRTTHLEGGIVGADIDVVALGRLSVVVKHPDEVPRASTSSMLEWEELIIKTKYKEFACPQCWL